MFGKNPIRKITRDPNLLAVEDIFYTIQGEGPYSGMPALFIRLSGCNLACTFCDTEFEQYAEKPKTLAEILEFIGTRFTEQQRKLVVLTGGEPMRQQLEGLIAGLLLMGTRIVQIETAGTVWQPALLGYIQTGRVVLVVSPKTVSISGGIAENASHFKYIIKAGEQSLDDGLPNRGTQPHNVGKEQRIWRPRREDYKPSTTSGLTMFPTIWVSPCDEYDPARNKLNMELCKNLALIYGYRISLQTHKILGVA
jgi:organic radical activating enzyme